MVKGTFGIMIIPVWPRFAWFHVLGRIAVDWLDIPREVCFFEDVQGALLSQRHSWSIRAVLFNAFGAQEEFQKERLWRTVELTEGFCRVLQPDRRVPVCEYMEIGLL